MKKFTNEQFDKFVRDSLYDYKHEPPLEVYESLKKEMLPKQKWLKYKILGSSLLMVSILWLAFAYLNNNEKTDINEYNYTTTNEQYYSNKLEDTPSKINDSKHLVSKSEIRNVQSNTNKDKFVEQTSETTTPISTSNRIEQDNNITKPLYKEEIKYEVITKASTCKKWNGKAIIRCNLPDITFFWKELNATKNIVENLKYGTYTVLAKKADEILDTIIITIPDSGSVKADFKIYETILGNEVFLITENSSLIESKLWNINKNVTFNWNFGDGTTYTQAEPRHSYTQSGKYFITLVAKTSHGCTDSISKSYILEIPQNFAELPNVFSPNGDGINDIFSPVLYDMQTIECTIFDRNGILIYEWKELSGYWDGKIRNTNQLASPGTYFYILKGTTKTGKQIVHKGMVQLVM